MSIALPHVPLRNRLFSAADVAVDRRRDGTIVLRNAASVPEGAASVGSWLMSWARQAPHRTFLAERSGPDQPWRTTSYAAALVTVERIATFLIRQNLSTDRPVVVLSENSIDHAMLALAAMQVGIPVATVPSSYSLAAGDFAALKEIVTLLSPGLIYVSDDIIYREALSAIVDVHDAVVVSGRAGTDLACAINFGAIQQPADHKAVRHCHEAVQPDTIARLLLTSDSTGNAKVVINTHAMLCSNQEARLAAWPFLSEEPPVIVDWLPWSHTFGANHNFNLVLRNGGSLYIDTGKPTPAAFNTTLANIKNVRPTIYLNVPRGYELLVQALEDDTVLRSQFFGCVRVMHFASGALSQVLWDELERLSIRASACTTPIVSSWGATETAPLSTDCNFRAGHSKNIGLPVAGTTVKLVPVSGKLEIRVRGPNVTPGYWRRADLTADAFDEERYFRTGDAVAFADPDRPERGLLYDGRIGDDLRPAHWGERRRVRRARHRCLSL